MLRLPIYLVLSFSLSLVTGCDSTGDAPSADAPTPDGRAVDASPFDGPAGTLATVIECAGLTPAGTVSFDAGLTPPTQTIAVGQVIKFHLLGEHTADSAMGLWFASGDSEKCVRFDGPGVYSFFCYFNADETGSITVE